MTDDEAKELKRKARVFYETMGILIGDLAKKKKFTQAQARLFIGMHTAFWDLIGDDFEVIAKDGEEYPEAKWKVYHGISMDHDMDEALK